MLLKLLCLSLITVNTIALAKPEKAKMVESMLIQMAQTGQIQGKVTGTVLLACLYTVCWWLLTVLLMSGAFSVLQGYSFITSICFVCFLIVGEITGKIMDKFLQNFGKIRLVARNSYIDFGWSVDVSRDLYRLISLRIVAIMLYHFSFGSLYMSHNILITDLCKYDSLPVCCNWGSCCCIWLN